MRRRRGFWYLIRLILPCLVMGVAGIAQAQATNPFLEAMVGRKYFFGPWVSVKVTRNAAGEYRVSGDDTGVQYYAIDGAVGAKGWLTAEIGTRFQSEDLRPGSNEQPKTIIAATEAPPTGIAPTPLAVAAGSTPAVATNTGGADPYAILDQFLADGSKLARRIKPGQYYFFGQTITIGADGKASGRYGSSTYPVEIGPGGVVTHYQDRTTYYVLAGNKVHCFQMKPGSSDLDGYTLMPLNLTAQEQIVQAQDTAEAERISGLRMGSLADVVFGRSAPVATPVLAAAVQSAQPMTIRPLSDPGPQTTMPAVTGPRIALVIGNAVYGGALGNLANPVNDAHAVTTALRRSGFDVVEVDNADQKTMKRAIIAFGQRLNAAGRQATGLFYYAGHGVQSNGSNFLVPVGAAIESEADVDVEAVAADTVLRQMEEAGTSTSIVILDACRNLPVQRVYRDGTRGLARMEAPNGSYVAYSTAPGSVAADGSGLNSPFASALVAEMAKPGQPIEAMFRNVRRTVLAATGGKQTPWDSSSLLDSFLFTPDAPGK
jgi:hypothetical protein